MSTSTVNCLPPDCSVIVLTKDNPVELSRTLDSLAIQRFPITCEIILIESWSNQEVFLSLLDGYRNVLNHFTILNFRAMPPLGIYPSMNVALNIFNGSTVTFLNSGDSYRSSNSLYLLFMQWQYLFADPYQQVKPKAVFAQARISAYSNKLRWNTPFFKSINISRWLKISWPCHQTVLFDGYWAKNNFYDPSRGLSSDRHIMIQALTGATNSCFCQHVIVDYSLDGVSSTPPCLKDILNPPKDLSIYDQIRYLFKFTFAPFWFFYPLIMMSKSLLLSIICLQNSSQRDSL